MIVDFRLYRAAFIPALLAAVTMMFSLQGIPPAVEPAVPTSGFESGPAMAIARDIVATAGDRTPGSEGDDRVADLVADRFGAIEAGTPSEQQFDATFDGDDVTLRNVLLTLPGETDDTIVVLAARDSVEDPGAASSAAATGVLVQLAEVLGVAGHSKTYVLASTSGASEGAAGARKLVDGLAGAGDVDAVVVISQPGAAEPTQPFVVTTATGAESGSAQLRQTAERAVETQTGATPSRTGAFGQLARLAIPSGLGEQAPLIEMDVDAVAISSAGERPLAAGRDQAEDVSGETVSSFGRATQSLVQALDAASTPLDEGPPRHLEVGGNLVPGWTLSLLALGLLLPAIVAAVDAATRALRRSEPLAAGLASAAALALPLLGGLALLYLLSFVGVVPRPEFPFDPALFEIGGAAIAAAVLVCGAIVATAALVRARSRAIVPSDAAVAGLGLTAVGAGVLVWLANPFLALLVSPTVHVWLLATRAPGLRAGATAAAAAVASLVPAVAALGHVVASLDLGAGAPWILAIMVADGQIGFWTMLALCFLAGSLAGAVIASTSGRKSDAGNAATGRSIR
ncbi:MAG: hypothetical protein ABWZ03_06705 [Solirubrobacterales bacterium]